MIARTITLSTSTVACPGFFRKNGTISISIPIAVIIASYMSLSHF
jgi:hypothetical protein